MSLLHQRARPLRRLFNDDLEACLLYLRCPLRHQRSVRTTNLLEGAFEESRRRIKGFVHRHRPRNVCVGDRAFCQYQASCRIAGRRSTAQLSPGA